MNRKTYEENNSRRVSEESDLTNLIKQELPSANFLFSLVYLHEPTVMSIKKPKNFKDIPSTD